jgi:hypothetical protein
VTSCHVSHARALGSLMRPYEESKHAKYKQSHMQKLQVEVLENLIPRKNVFSSIMPTVMR